MYLARDIANVIHILNEFGKYFELPIFWFFAEKLKGFIFDEKKKTLRALKFFAAVKMHTSFYSELIAEMLAGFFSSTITLHHDVFTSSL